MKAVVAIAAIALLAGCATPQPDQKSAAPAAPAAPAADKKAADTAKARADAIKAAKAKVFQFPPAIYFDYDKFDIREKYHPVVSAFGNYLAVDDKAKVVVEGNADERGTVEYNLALGQKRAEAVSIGLQAVGAKPTQIETISFGEEKPWNKGKTEEAYAENRRADLKLR